MSCIDGNAGSWAKQLFYWMLESIARLNTFSVSMLERSPADLIF